MTVSPRKQLQNTPSEIDAEVLSNMGILGQNSFGPTLYTQRYWDRDLCVVFLLAFLDVGLGQTLADRSLDMRGGSQILRALQSVKDLGGRKSCVV